MGNHVTRHRARCRCGALAAVADGAPVRVSVCHCLTCQRRWGSAFSAQVRFPDDRVTVSGAASVFEHIGDSGAWARFHFCPTCSDTLYYRIEAMPGVIAVPLGAFDNPHAFTPEFSVWEDRRHPWVAIMGDIEHHG